MIIRFLGSEAFIAETLSRWPQIQPVGGHTDILIDPKVEADRRLAQEIFQSTVLVKRFAAIDTTYPDAPKRMGTLDMDATEVTLFSPLAGG